MRKPADYPLVFRNILERHSDLYRRALRESRKLLRHPQEKAEFVGNVQELFTEAMSLPINTSADICAHFYRLGTDWQVALGTLLETAWENPFEPPTESAERPPLLLSDEEIEDWVSGLATTFGPQGRRRAEVYLASDALAGDLDFPRQMRPASYYRLEDIWLSEVIELNAYHIWKERGGYLQFDAGKGDYFEETARCCQILANPAVKASPIAFLAPRAYLMTRYLSAMRLDKDQGNAKALIERKARHIMETTQSDDYSALLSHAGNYVQDVYENILQAIENADRESIEKVLWAFHRSQEHPSRCSIINCFEAALAVYFMDADTVQNVWGCPVPYSGTF